jgi:hypothetical protein
VLLNVPSSIRQAVWAYCVMCLEGSGAQVGAACNHTITNTGKNRRNMMRFDGSYTLHH